MIIYIYCYSCYSCQILMKLEFSRQFFEIFTNIKLHKNPFSGSGAFPCGRTDRRDENKNRFSKFCESA